MLHQNSPLQSGRWNSSFQQAIELYTAVDHLSASPELNRIADWCQRTHDLLAEHANDADTVALWQKLFIPVFMKSTFLRRCREKPLGYAGDYLTIQMMYDDKPSGIDGLGLGIDYWALNQPCPRAVRNRKALVSSLLKDVSTQNAKHASVVSLGCGPATEILEAGIANIDFTLVDIDRGALAFAMDRAQQVAILANKVHAMQGNIIRMALRDDGRIEDSSVTAFYSLGVIDYFSDDIVIRLLNFIHKKLVPGGVVFLGNFRPDHPNEALFCHALDWPLTLRTGAHLTQLFNQSAFANCQITIGSEPEGVQLFLKARKA